MPSEAQKNAGYLLPDDVQSILDAELVPFCGLIPDTKYTRAALQGTIFELAKWWNWEKSFKSGDRRAANVAGYLLDILTDHFQIAEGCGVTLQLRQNELNPCLLEQSLDGGETWTTAFNYNLCTSTSEQGILDAINLLSDQVQDYADTLQDYLDNAGYVPNNITIADNALCWTIKQFVALVIDAVKQERQQQGGEMLLAGGLLGGVTLAVGAIIGIATVGVGLLAMGVAAAVMAVAGGVWAGLSDALLNNEEAIDTVVCCMYAALSGTVPTRATLQTSLDNCGFAPLTNEAQLAGAISASLAETELQMVFFELLSTAIDFSANIPAVDCTCSDTCPTCFDMTDTTCLTNNYGTVDATEGNPAPSLMSDVWTDSTGYPYNSSDNRAYRRVVSVIREFDTDTDITSVSFDFKSSFDSNDHAQGIALVGVAVQDAGGTSLFRQQTVETQTSWTAHSVAVNVTGARKVWVWVGFNTDAGGATGSAWLDNLCIQET